MKILRQGDVVLTPAELPRAAKLTGSEVRIASETGNPHVLNGRVYRVSRQQQYVVLDAPAEMTHPQHAALRLEPGTYRVSTVRDYLPTRLLD
jgi:predicted phage tail protein